MIPEWVNDTVHPANTPEYYRARKDFYKTFWLVNCPHDFTDKKFCATCGNEYLSLEFTICRTQKDGLGWHCSDCRRRSQILMKYRMIVDDPYNLGQCEVCEDEIATEIDHDHACCSGKFTCGKCVRGFVCHRCNLIMRDGKDDTNLMKRAIIYLENHG